MAGGQDDAAVSVTAPLIVGTPTPLKTERRNRT
eukprot:CAMPEP_0171968286 /NCGR_PEP_ID=MMETSP0993-20121228/202493_1 /TAXON_ID=483369 /ORGANISM="non described non described, Strain CCMP2098" /LENGTH=32 /DNA_ID= /DNA_START= /DNA_END= /DNA_ORIENTATION=